MLSLLLSSANSKIVWNWANSENDYSAPDRDFDLKYTRPNENDPVSTTFANKGWMVILRNPPGPNGNRYYVVGEQEGTYTNETMGLKVATKFDQSFNENFIRVIFEVTNTGSQPQSIDLATYVDITIGGDDTAEVHALPGLTGLVMVSQYNTVTKGDAITLVARDHFNVTNVDFFWYGEAYRNESAAIDVNRTNEDPLTYTDSAFQLGWLNRKINPRETQSFNVLLAMGSKIRLPPQIECLRDSLVFDEEETFKLPIRYKSLYGEVPLELYSTNTQADGAMVDSFTTTDTSKAKDFDVPFTHTDGQREKQITIYAKDKDTTLLSDKFVANVIINKKPTFRVDGSVKDSLYWGDKLEFPVTITDDTKAKVVYEFNGQKFTDGELVSSNTQTVVKIPTDSLPAKSYELKVYAIDENGAASKDSKTYTVKVNNPPPPEFDGEPTISSKNPKPGETVIITARVKNPLKRDYKVKTVINGQTYETNIPPTDDEWTDVKYEVKIPEDAKKTQNLDISVLNSRNDVVKSFQKSVSVNDDSAAQEELAKKKKEEEEKKKNALIGAIVGSIAGLALLAGVAYYLFAAAKKRKSDEEEETSEHYIGDIELTDHIAKEVSKLNNEIFPVNVENYVEGEPIEFTTQDPIEM